MKDILSNQHVRRRKSPVRKESSGKIPVFRSEGFAYRRRNDDEFIRQVKQKPLRHEGEKRKRSPVSLAFSLPLLPAAGFCMLLVGIILTFSNRDALSFAWIDRDVISGASTGVDTGENQAMDYEMALYAGTTPRIEAGAAAETSASPGISLVPVMPEPTGGITLVPETVPSETVPDAEIPLDLAETFAWKTYTVQRGDSVSKIATAHSLSMDAVIASNDLVNASLLRVGEVLRLPNMDGIPYIVQKGDSLSKISASMGVPMEAILDANDIQRDVIKAGELVFIPGARMRTEDLKFALGELFAYPIKGARLTSPYGWRNDPISGVRRHHAAIDLAASTGTAVLAASAGKVSATGYNGTYGNFIILSHGNNYQTMYAHLNLISVKEGGQVEQGAKIGEVGSTGYSTGPHLHFAVYRNGQAVNPLDYLHQ